MSLIYEPKGRAREYSPLALNVYMQCSHGCKYCYAAAAIRKTLAEYTGKPMPRENIVEKLAAELRRSPQIKQQVLLSFIGDVYCDAADNNMAITDILNLFLQFQVPCAILTKGGTACLHHLPLFQKFGNAIQVGATLTFDNDEDSLEWEPGAAPVSDRLAALKALHEAGIQTFASFEPVIKPEQSLNLMRQTLDYIDVYKVGKVNHFQDLDKSIDWTDFLSHAVAILRGRSKKFYIKRDLREAAPDIEPLPEEKKADLYNVKWEGAE